MMLPPGARWREARGSVDDWQYVGDANVDTGLILIADPCYSVSQDEPPSYESWDSFLGDVMEEQGVHENGTAEFSTAGVVVSTGVGDGQFPVFVQRDVDGQVIAAMIRFDQSPVYQAKRIERHSTVRRLPSG